MNSESYVYILGNARPVLYIGVTSNLEQRIAEHKNGKYHGFAKKYGLHKLLYFETYPSIQEAIAREKQLKGWHREWKLHLIQDVNPNLKDLSVSTGDPEASPG